MIKRPPGPLLPATLGILLLLGGWWFASWKLGSTLLPTPPVVLSQLASMATETDALQQVSITLSRTLLGLTLGFGCALVLGLLAGHIVFVRHMINPVVAAMQSFPTIVWLTLLMVWVGTGSEVIPAAVVFMVTFPVLFANVLQGYISIDQRLFAMSNLYRVPLWRVIRHIVIPSVIPHVLAGLSYGVAASWRVTIVAEFLGSASGMGARIYWSYRMLDMPQLFAWSTIAVSLGVALECLIIAPMRKKSTVFTGRVRDTT